MPNDMGERMVNEIFRIGTYKNTQGHTEIHMTVLDILVMVICFALLFETFITLRSKMKMSMFILV